jgi:hypothetical protein
MRRGTIIFALFAVCFQIPFLAAGQVSELRGPRIGTTTRLVAQFSGLEQRLNRAIQHSDEATLNKLLAEEFQQWTPAPPGDPMPREEWLRKVLTGFTLRSLQLRQMAVQMVGETAVVSFVQSQRAVCDGRDCSGSSFIVDLWQPHDGAPRLLVRYDSQRLARQPPPSLRVPTGKE